MFDFRYNVYETFERVHEIVDNADADADEANGAAAMDRAEYLIQVNKLVEGLVEMLQHAAQHTLLSLDAGEHDHDIEVDEIGVYRNEEDEPAGNHRVAFHVPDYLLPDEENAVSAAIKAFDLTTVETTAEVALAAHAHAQFVNNRIEGLDERLYDAWALIAERLIPRVAPAVQRLDAAGLIKVYDARTKQSYFPVAVMTQGHGPSIEVTISTLAPGVPPDPAPA